MVAEKDSEDREAEAEEMESEEKEEQNPSSDSVMRLPQEYMAYIDKELGMVKFFDYLAEESFDLIHQDKTITTYKKQLIAGFFGVSDDLVGEPDDFHNKRPLFSEFKQLEIEENLNKIKIATEEVALDHGVKKPFHKRLQTISLGISASVIALMIGINFIPGVSEYSTYILLGAMLVMCFVPQLLRKRMTKKWNDFKFLHRKEVEERAANAIEQVRNFNQILINDCRDFCVENRIPLQLINFSLFSNSYENLDLKKENIRNDQIQYQYQLAYPEGMEPFEIPGSIAKIDSPGLVGSSHGSDMDIPEDDENDLFILLKGVTYSESGHVEFDGLSYLDEEKRNKIEEVLVDSEFIKVADPENIIENFGERSDIHCGCDKSVELGELHIVKTEDDKNFQFYMIIGSKCMECGNNPFIIFQKAGVEIPDSFRDVFNV